MGGNRNRQFVLVAWMSLVAGAAQLAEAQTPADVLAEKLRAGDQLTITVRDLARIRGKLVAVGTEGLVVTTEAGEQEVPFGAIERVSRKRMGVLLGPIIGAGVGVACAIPVAMLFTNEGAEPAGPVALLIGLGAGTGLLIDAVINLPRTVYRREARPRVQVVPQIGRDGQALALQVRF